MNLKFNQILIGIILLLIGGFALLQNHLHLSSSDITLVVVGCAFLLLYRTKRKSWSLILGVLLTYLGASSLISDFTGFNFDTSAMFFLIPAIIFLILYFRGRQGFLIPGSTLLWFGLYLLLRNLSVFFFIYRTAPQSAFFICMAAAFIMIYMLGKSFIGRWPIYIGCIFLILGGITIARTTLDLSFIQYLPMLLSIGVIITGAAIILRALLKKGG